MKVLASAADAGRALAGPVVAVGNFDGVHLGHRRVLETAVACAREIGAPSLAMTFRPHPAAVLAGRAPERLATDAQQEDALAALGLDALLREPFDEAMAEMQASAFYCDVLRGRLGARGVVVGASFRFGAARRGDLTLLKSLAREEGAAGPRVVDVPPVIVRGDVVSSTRIRGLVARGDVKEAAALLGRPWSLEGRVVHGDGRGRTLGVPTANVEPLGVMTPAPGVYACVAHRGTARHAAACNVGRRPSFGGGALVVEAHLLDFDADLYDEVIRLGFLERLRDERAFASLESLKAQLGEDVARARLAFDGAPAEALGPPGGW